MSAAHQLKGIKVFVGGPIQHALIGRSLNTSLTGYIKSAISLLESLGAEVFSAHRAEQFGAKTHLFTPNEVSQRDRHWMETCDIFVAILPASGAAAALVRTDGTHIELGWASALKRPIVLVTPVLEGTDASHLLKGLPAIARVLHIPIEHFEQDYTVLVDAIHGMVQSHGQHEVPSVSPSAVSH